MAGYAQAKPPAGWSAARPASGNNATFTFGSAPATVISRGGAAANDAVYTHTVVDVGGTSITMPATMRFASNAGRFLASQGFRPGPAILPQMLLWVTTASLPWIWDELAQRWMTPDVPDSHPSDEFEYWVQPYTQMPVYPSPERACKGFVDFWAGSYLPGMTGQILEYLETDSKSLTCFVRVKSRSTGQVVTPRSPFSIGKRPSNCPVGAYWTPAGCMPGIEYRPLTKPEFEEGLAPYPWPEGLPEIAPEGVPVEMPRINPKPDEWGESRPHYEPTGDPVPNPRYNPNEAPGPNNQPFDRPGIRVNPSPVPDNPWRVDIQPVDNPWPDANPDSTPDPGSTPRPSGDRPSICELYPNISACQVLGDAPDAKDLSNTELPVRVVPEDGFGPSNASCPPPQVINTSFGSYSLSWDPACDFATGLRPIIIALAWFSVAFAMFGIGGRD